MRAARCGKRPAVLSELSQSSLRSGVLSRLASWIGKSLSQPGADAPNNVGPPDQISIAIPSRPPFQDHSLGLQKRQQSLSTAFATDPGLLEPAERDTEVSPESVVPHRA